MRIKAGQVGHAPEERALDLRVCFVPASMGESVTVRLLDASNVALELKSIDYSEGDRERIERALEAPWGIILVTGPTGSGKTTVLYSCLNELAGSEKKIMSIEDPVEYHLPWVTQIPVRANIGFTFSRAMRSVLRSDPDAILIGEIRDRETLGMAQKAALTGHLVLSTLHTDEAANTLKRMIEIGSDPFLVADATKLVISQRLVRKVCPSCGVEKKPSAKETDRAAEAARGGGMNLHGMEMKFRKAVGCGKCSSTGYRGRTVVSEMLEVTPEIGNIVRNGANVDKIREIAVGQGMTTMVADGIRRAAMGQTTLAEIARVFGWKTTTG
ncbi:GspE/PulE family protein [Planctomycetota bacterium]